MEVHLCQIILIFVLLGVLIPLNNAKRNETAQTRQDEREAKLKFSHRGGARRRIPKRKSGKIEVSPSEGSGDESNVSSFSDWGGWSRCRNCKQFRTRHCINVDECEDKIQRMYRPCPSPHCKPKLLIMMANRGDSKKRPKKVRIIRKLEPYLYTEWSDWSPCSSSCYTKRTRKCRFPGLCDNSSSKEDYKQCYRDGDECEKMFFDRQQLVSMHHKHTDESSDGLMEDHPLDNMECGIPNLLEPTVPPGALRITGGRPSVKGAWPWQALILNSDHEPFCGGILLSEKWVLTAAHCIRKRLYVRAGEYDLSHDENTEQELLVVEIYKYPKYDQNTVDNDIALLKMQTPFQLNSYVKPICLPLKTDKLPKFSRLTILGWGKRRNYSNYGTDILHEANVPIVDYEECQKSYHDSYISDNMLCAGYEHGMVDSCKGDSGGPLMYQRKDGTWAVFGVTSFGDGCGEAKKYGVYANVLKYLSWIRNIIKRGEMSLYDDDDDDA